jgi:carboxylesterase type B
MLRVFVAVAVLCATARATPQTVVTADGPVAGSFNPKSGVYSFKGVPYAQPPVGDLRFADTVPVTPWSATRPATEFSAGCMSVCEKNGFPHAKLMCAATLSEDCLYVNVYTPNVTKGAPLLPVIFFIHGGNYAMGAGGVPMYDGTALVMAQGVVVVTINYRLNIFGGLFTGDDAVAGNFQTKDQREAMRWVQRNVGAFGGDKGRVTITGQSAGAFSVAVHLSSPKSNGLYAHAIMVSDPLGLPASTKADALRLGQAAIAKINCSMTAPVEQLRCLRAASAEDILALQNTDFKPGYEAFLAMPMQWVPFTDPATNELPLAPVVALAEGKYNRVPVMFGTTANESVQFIHGMSPKPMSAAAVGIFMDIAFGFENAATVKRMYGAPPADQKDDARPWLAYVATDYLFLCAGRYVGGGMAKVAPTFMYYFDYLFSSNEWTFGKYMPFCVKNVCHAEDLAAIFNPFKWGMPPGVVGPNTTASDDYVIAVIQSAWGNFARTGNPNPLARVQKGVGFTQFNATVHNLVNYSYPTADIVGFHDAKCNAMNGFASPPYTLG